MSAAEDKKWDVIVIGGGPSGMMAAARACERGLSVLLLEKNTRLGKKLSISGGGRCNVTNNKPDVRTMLAKYKEAGKFLFSTYTQHGVTESIEWFNARGVDLKEENEGRLFPTTNSAETVCQTLEKALTVGVVVKTDVEVFSITLQDAVFTIETNNACFQTSSCVVASGGLSRPDTGSTGDGFKWLRALGHTIHNPSLALVPIALKDNWIEKVSGLTLQDVKITLRADGKKQLVERGKLLFTHVGVSGPTILNMSSTVAPLLKHSSVSLDIDLFPDKDTGTMRKELSVLLQEKSNQKIRNSLSDLLPKALVVQLLEQMQIDPDTEGHSFLQDDRKRFVESIKALRLTVARLLGADKAVISSGGVALEEVDFKTMESRIVPGLHVAGDMLNVDRPSGGYGLQLAWSTGWVAGEQIGRKIG